MANESLGARPRIDRRRSPRVQVSLPITCYQGGATALSGIAPFIGETRDLSASGVYVTLSASERVEAGDLLRIAMVIPGDERRRVPFTRISGACRVLRVEPDVPASRARQGVALAFCEEQLTMLGAI